MSEKENEGVPRESLCDMAVVKPFLDGEGRLKSLPAKFGKRQQVLRYLAERIPTGRIFTEKELCALLSVLALCSDPCTLRRELYEAGLVGRNPDGSGYWRVEESTDFSGISR